MCWRTLWIDCSTREKLVLSSCAKASKCTFADIWVFAFAAATADGLGSFWRVSSLFQCSSKIPENVNMRSATPALGLAWPGVRPRSNRTGGHLTGAQQIHDTLRHPDDERPRVDDGSATARNVTNAPRGVYLAAA